MESYKLTYLNLRGRCELVRFILAYANVKFDDVRHEPTKWFAIRPDTQLGIIPTLEFDGIQLSGNATIARYLAEKYGLSGESPEENAEIFSIVECVEDLWLNISTFFWESDETRKAALKRRFSESYLPLTLKKLEKMASLNCSAEGWIKGSKVTYADFAVSVILEEILRESPSVGDSIPTLKKLKASVEELPAIKEWIATRPNTPY